MVILPFLLLLQVRFLTKIYHPNIDKVGKWYRLPFFLLQTKWCLISVIICSLVGYASTFLRTNGVQLFRYVQFCWGNCLFYRFSGNIVLMVGDIWLYSALYHYNIQFLACTCISLVSTSMVLAYHCATILPTWQYSVFSIQALLSAPNPDDPLSDNIAKHWKSNEAEAVETGTCSYSKHSYEYITDVLIWQPLVLQRRSGLACMQMGQDNQVLFQM